jgi:hypothetical protein
MTFTFSKSSWDEFKTLEVIDITTEVPWHPIMHSDDPFALRSMNENTAYTAIKKDPPAYKNGMDDDSGFYDTDQYPDLFYLGDSFSCT